MVNVTQKAVTRAVTKAGGFRAAERLLREQGYEISERTIRRMMQREEYDIEDAPERVDVQALLERRFAEYEGKKSYETATHIRTVRLRSNRPIGIGFQGDGHLDDPGTNLKQFFEHAELFNGEQKGLYLAFLGDIFNNWVGRLQAIYGKQNTTSEEAKALIEHYCGMCNFLFVILGNHDLWNEKEDMLQYLFRASSNIVTAHEQRVKLVFPNGREIVIHARHKFNGNSMWMTQFGQIKAAQLDGTSDIYVGGDKHVSGYSNGIHPGTKRMYHALQVASYKVYDDYPIELGLMSKQLYTCPVAIINPKATDDLNLIRWEFDPFEGAERLAWEQSRG